MGVTIFVVTLLSGSLFRLRLRLLRLTGNSGGRLRSPFEELASPTRGRMRDVAAPARGLTLLGIEYDRRRSSRHVGRNYRYWMRSCAESAVMSSSAEPGSTCPARSQWPLSVVSDALEITRALEQHEPRCQ